MPPSELFATYKFRIYSPLFLTLDQIPRDFSQHFASLQHLDSDAIRLLPLLNIVFLRLHRPYVPPVGELVSFNIARYIHESE